VTCDGTDPPIRHTISLAGADDVVDGLVPELQAAAAPASTTAAPTATTDLVRFTARSPFLAFSRKDVLLADASGRPRCDVASRLCG
jgi:hypothetical protein